MTLVTAGAVTLGMAGFVAVIQAGPALADPTIQFAAVGSDTIQDVMNQFSVDLSGNLLGSFNAVDPVTGASPGNVQYIKGPNAANPTLSCNFTRPNGSGAGLVSLRFSINQSSTATPVPTVKPQQGCVDIGRSSSAVSTANQAPTGSLVYIPFAIDAVTGSVGPATAGTAVAGSTGAVNTAATLLTNPGAPYYDFVNFLTQAELSQLYSCPATTGTNQGAVTVADSLAPGGSVLVNPNVSSSFTLPAGQVQIDLYIPQPGSGTLSFWLGASALNVTQAACDHQTIVNAATTPVAGSPFPCPTGSPAGCGVTTYNGVTVEEHNGVATAVDPNGYFPFSIAQWLSQNNHPNIDRRYGAQLQSVGGVAPCTAAGTPGNCTMAGSSINHTTFPFVREVFNIVQYNSVLSTSPTFNQALASMFVGAGSSLCSDGITLFLYGFAQLPSTNPKLVDQCGSIANTLRAFDPATNPV